MKTFKVGGSVRDSLMGLEPHDHDFVVVGSTPAEMESLGFKQVGKDFPVFLHPDTGEEYALARTERKTGAKHTDFETVFDPSVTIAMDLSRRDLTMNAIAMSETGELIDPFHGVEDIKNKVIRHVSEAFAEDPLRILRVCRFKARFPDFRVHSSTKELMVKMVEEGALDHISKERFWAETKKALLSTSPVTYFEMLREVNALKYVSIIGDGDLVGSMMLESIIELTEFLSEERKLILRAVEFFSFQQTILNEKDFRKKLHKAKIPLEIIDLAEFFYKFADEFMLNVVPKQLPKVLVSHFDAMNLRIMVQKNPNFLEDLKLLLLSWDTASEQHLDQIIFMMEAYLDTKEFLSCEMKRFEWANSRKPNVEEIKEFIAAIKLANVSAAQDSFWRGIHLNLNTLSFETVPIIKD